MDKKKLKIAIYDTKGELHDTVEGEYDGDGLLDTMEGIVGDEGIPVVRMQNETAKPVDDSGPMLNHQRLNEVFSKPLWEYIPHTAEPILMKMEMKVDQQTLSCEGFGHEVLKAQENFLRAIMPEFEGE